MNKTKTDQMKQVRDDVINLKESPLYEFRISNGYYPVIGEGNHDANIMFIGEGPGKNEAETGHPFCGASGKILDELLKHVGINRSEVYIANILKDRPPSNRDPTSEEIEIYAPFLDRQISIIEPKIIATLGRYSMVYIMEKFGLKNQLEPIGVAHGKVYDVDQSFGNMKIASLYHPAVAVYNANTKDDLKKDFEILKRFV